MCLSNDCILAQLFLGCQLLIIRRNPKFHWRNPSNQLVIN
nr:MAG TPA: hypothetical protein [Bacteriophage sp.]